jgi:acylphosphatase
MSRTDAQQTVHVIIKGRVQGVGFRYFTERAAAELELAGFVRNRRDGTVEALFCGSPTAVAEMLERCRRGPPGARVAAVRIIAEGGEEPFEFAVLPTV